jgi:hypothetical protein
MADLSKLREAMAKVDGPHDSLHAAYLARSAVFDAVSDLLEQDAAREVAAQADDKPAVAQGKVAEKPVLTVLLPHKDVLGEVIAVALNAQPAVAGVPEGWVMVDKASILSLVAGPANYHHKMNDRQEEFARGFDRCREQTIGRIELYFATRAAMLSAAPAAPASEGVEKLREFAQWAIRHAWVGLDIDGGDAQDMAEKLGLIEQYEVFESCGEECACAEGDFPAQCYRFAPILAAAKPGEVSRG